MDLLHHPDYATNPLRVVHRRALDRELGELFVQQPAVHWVEALRAAGVPVSPVLNLAEVVENAQAQARDMFPLLDGRRVTGLPVKMSKTPGKVTTTAPTLGEHTRAVLESVLSLDAMELDRLEDEGILHAGQ